MSVRRAIAVLFSALVASCGAAPIDPPSEPETPVRSVADEQIDWMLEHADDYLEDRAWRRAQLEPSLWRPELPYASKRLNAYALPEGGWDLLPEFDVDVHSVGAEPQNTVLEPEVPTTRQEWLELGEQVFFNMPMRRDSYLEWIVTDPELTDSIGLQRRDDGAIRGLVEFVDGYGDTRQGATCGMCHSLDGVPGEANTRLDLGKARALFGERFGIDNSQYAEWGPGTVDVTDDQVGDALAIPSLWSVEHQTHLNTSGAIELTSPAALAIRFETQYIVGHSMLERPHRVFVWALTMYVLSLEAGTEPATDGPGVEVFERACASCHIPAQAFGGPLVDASTLNYDERAANSVYRGTGFYRAPTLIGISRADSFMHDARVGSLEEVLSSGHPYGTTLDEDEQIELLQFLNTL